MFAAAVTRFLSSSVCYSLSRSVSSWVIFPELRTHTRFSASIETGISRKPRTNISAHTHTHSLCFSLWRHTDSNSRARIAPYGYWTHTLTLLCFADMLIFLNGLFTHKLSTDPRGIIAEGHIAYQQANLQRYKILWVSDDCEARYGQAQRDAARYYDGILSLPICLPACCCYDALSSFVYSDKKQKKKILKKKSNHAEVKESKEQSREQKLVRECQCLLNPSRFIRSLRLLHHLVLLPCLFRLPLLLLFLRHLLQFFSHQLVLTTTLMCMTTKDG